MCNMILWATFGISSDIKENSKHASIRQLQARIGRKYYLRHKITNQLCLNKKILWTSFLYGNNCVSNYLIQISD